MSKSIGSPLSCSPGSLTVKRSALKAGAPNGRQWRTSSPRLRVGFETALVQEQVPGWRRDVGDRVG